MTYKRSKLQKANPALLKGASLEEQNKKKTLSKKLLKIQKTNPVLLKGASLEEQNHYIQQVLDMNGIKNKIRFEPETLQKFVDEKKTFGKGLVAYLIDLEKQLDQVIDDKDLKLYIFQILSELGSLVFPNTSACYSIIPNDLKQLEWEQLISEASQKFKKKEFKEISEITPILNVFLNKKNIKAVSYLVSLCLCMLLTRALKKDMNGLLIDNQSGKLTGKEGDDRPRIKSADWLQQLARMLQTHLTGLQQKELTPIQIKLLGSYSISLAEVITEELKAKELLESFKTIEIKAWGAVKTPRYFAWSGSSLLVFPRTLSLPMVCRPEGWSINPSKGADNGGYLLSSLTNISYQGYLDSKSFQMHAHRLRLNKIDQINSLQTVAYAINCPIIYFYKKYKEELTNNEELLLSDTWIKPTAELTLERNIHWSKQFASPDSVQRRIATELIANKNETWRNQETLKIAELYSNKIMYWPAVQDFRGRIYRIGHLNIQLGKYVRSLTSFYSDKPFVNRKKNKYTLAKFNLLLKEVLVKKDLIEKWDTVFGDRFIYTEKFEELLLEDFLAKKLSLIQIGQLLLIRQGAYDKVGVYYDASASAYQIMGVINEDYALCQLTNVLEKDGSQQDIYSFFLTQMKKNIDKYTVYSKDKEIVQMYDKHLRDNVDRKLMKAIVMPLIYGKTAKGFAEDLKPFFAKGYLYPNGGALIRLASQIIKTLKEDPVFTKISVFMKGLNAIAGLLFDLNKLIIRSPYGDSCIVYYKDTTEEFVLYFNRNTTVRKRSQKITLHRPKRDPQGNVIKSKKKAVSAFLANYVHFLDASVCHYVIDALAVESTLNLGTIHDSFFIKPEKVDILRKAYKEGLIKAHKIHLYNMVRWLYDIQGAKGPNKSKLEAIIERLRLLTVGNETLEADNAFLQQISWTDILKSLKPIKPERKHAKLIEFLKLDQPKACLKMQKHLNTNCGQLLFPDN